MKSLLPIILLFIVGCYKAPIKIETTLIEKDGLKYHAETKELYTGKVYENYLGGKKKFEGNYKSGLMYGNWRYYYENGQIKHQGYYVNGDGSYFDNYPDSLKLKFPPSDGRSGKWTEWYENGQKKSEETWKNGKAEGLITGWHKNGQKKIEGTFKDGKLNGLNVGWYENGQKNGKGTFKDGKPDGLHTIWYQNGQKKSEASFEDGIFISGKDWYEDGSLKE